MVFRYRPALLQPFWITPRNPTGRPNATVVGGASPILSNGGVRRSLIGGWPASAALTAASTSVRIASRTARSTAVVVERAAAMRWVIQVRTNYIVRRARVPRRPTRT